MKFWKMNGAGNDFIILNNLEEHLPQTACRKSPGRFANGIYPSELMA